VIRNACSNTRAILASTVPMMMVVPVQICCADRIRLHYQYHDLP